MSTSTQQQPEAPTSGPKTTLTVPAKPAAITGANLLTLAGTAAVAGGPIGWLAAAGVVGAPVAAVAARRAYRNRAERRQRTRKERTEKTSTSGSPGRKGLFGKSPRSGGGSGSGTGKRPGRGGSGQPGGRHAAGSPGSGRSGRNPLGRLLPGGKGRGGPVGSGSGGPGSGRGGRGDGQPGGKKGLLPNWLRGKNNAPGGGGKGSGKNGPGGSGTSGPGGGKKRGGPSDGTIRKWGPCNGIEDRSGRSSKKPKGPDKNGAGEKPTKPVKPTVDRGPQQRGPGVKPPGTRPAPARPGTPVRLPGQPTRTTAGGDMSAGTRETAGRMWANTAAWEPKGMLDAVEEFHDLPQSLAYVRATVGTLMEKSAGRLPLDSAIAKQIGQIVALLDTAAKMAPKVPEAIEAIHKAELDRLRRPRNGESKWDRAANGLA